MSKIFVTGLGLMTAIGDSMEANRQSLIQGQSGIGRAQHFSSKYADIFPFGEIPQSNTTLAQPVLANSSRLTRTDLIAWHAMEQAIKDAGLNDAVLQESSTAFINASTVGGMCLTDEMYADANSHNLDHSPFLSSYPNSACTLFLQSYFKIGGLADTFNTACSSSANAIMFGSRLLKNGVARKAIVGGTDSLAKFTVNGFNALMILSNEPCRPFDAGRKGLNLGEGAGYLVLEREADIKPGQKVYAEVMGYGNNNDAYHPSSTSETAEGPFLCMQGALKSAGLKPEAIDFINAHGTATENNDVTESIAMLRLFSQPPPFSSTKSYTGHTLGAAGVVGAIYSILNLYHQEVYPALNFDIPIENTQLVPVGQYLKKPLQNVMSNSFGFGGNCTSLIFGKV